ncbi:ABC transporter permease [bacterium]|nr:ABC transporter permease [bacterium]
MISIVRFVFIRFIVRIIWIGLLATFGIQLLLTFLPPKRVIDPRSTIQEKTIVQQWSTARYVDWLLMIAKGSPQVSDSVKGDWQTEELRKRAKNTLVLCWNAFILASLIGVVIGTIQATLNNEVVSGKKRGSVEFLTSFSTLSLFFLSSIPAYIIAYFLFLVLKSESNLFLAVLALALGSGSAMDVLRLTSNVHDRELQSKYIENALACGLKTSGIVPLPGSVPWHAFRNSLITILPVTAYRLPLIVSSALVVEVVFDLPGLGESLLNSLIQQDVPMVLTIILISVVFVQICVFLADICVYMLHPQKHMV